MEQWEKNYYISTIAGADNGSSLVVMSKGRFGRLLSKSKSWHQKLLLMENQEIRLLKKICTIITCSFCNCLFRHFVHATILQS